MSNILILGGAGFIGSNITELFAERGYNVTVIDGLLEKTGGRKENLNSFLERINFINYDIKDVENLKELVEQSDIIIDSMAWTSHRSGMANPEYDLKLNLESHLVLINTLRTCQDLKDKKIIYLATKVQYGSPKSKEITEETKMNPEDIQGTHKLAAESYFRIYSKINKLNVISLRLPNCFGENQPVEGADIGLIGSLTRDILNGKTIEVFGEGRKRNFVYVKDLAETISRLIEKEFTGFHAFNFSGKELIIDELVENLISIIGKGSYIKKPLPDEIKFMEAGNAMFIDKKLKDFLGKIPRTDLKSALEETIGYFKENLK